MFTTLEILSSPYNYRRYVPERAASLWFFEDWGQDVFVWEGKGSSYYYSFDPKWREASNHASRELKLFPRRERARKRYLVRRCIAFVMGSHPRLGALSLIRSLDPNLLQMIVPSPLNG